MLIRVFFFFFLSKAQNTIVFSVWCKKCYACIFRMIFKETLTTATCGGREGEGGGMLDKEAIFSSTILYQLEM